MNLMQHRASCWLGLLSLLFVLPVSAQSFRVQCPSSTDLHPLVNGNGVAGQTNSTLPNPGIKCQHISGGDGYATMADGTQTYLFAFGPLSGLADIAAGLPTGGTQTAALFNATYTGPQLPSDIGTVAPNNAAVRDPAMIMNTGVLNGNQPAPLMSIDEDDEFYLTLSNVGMIMRPDLFEQHTVHFHGYPNASSYYDGVPDASVAIQIAGSFTYYYTAPEAGTYFWHCHITPPEHLQMGMVGQLYVRPRQDKVAPAADMVAALRAANLKVVQSRRDTADVTGAAPDGTRCTDLLCTGQTALPKGVATAAREGAKVLYAYNDGDGSTAYDVEYPMQLMSFDPNFHYVAMTFNPENFAGMKDKYFLLNGRGYPDTVSAPGQTTESSDGISRPSQPLSSLIKLSACADALSCAGKSHRALLRLSDLNVTEFHTIATIGVPMKVVGYNARLLRDEDGNNLAYLTNSITIAGGESADVILDSMGIPVGTYYLYTTNLDHLSNDAENFGGMMTEIDVVL
jgi:hypothetical protein